MLGVLAKEAASLVPVYRMLVQHHHGGGSLSMLEYLTLAYDVDVEALASKLPEIPAEHSWANKLRPSHGMRLAVCEVPNPRERPRPSKLRMTILAYKAALKR